jgi:Polysaccharide pyruvyl transferase
MNEPRPRVRVGIVSGTLGHVPESYRLPTATILENAVGSNTGNLAFRHAVHGHIAPPNTHVPWGSDPGWVREMCDLLVIPSSNQVNPAADFSARADFLDKVNLPCLALGLGVQAPAPEVDIHLGHGTIRYLRSLAARSRSIGVRGEYTAAVLAKYAIKNTVVIGCPSNFINPAATLGAAIERKLGAGVFDRLVMTDVELQHRALDRKLFRWMLKSAGAYVCQSQRVLISLARGRMDEVIPAEMDYLQRYLMPRRLRRLRSRSWFAAMSRRRMRVFFDVGAWLEFLAGFDLALGVRFHGNLLAVQAGTPGICIAHDARTQELCTTTRLPQVSLQQVISARSVAEVVEAAAFDGAGYDTRRTLSARAYRKLLADSGVEVSARLNALTIEPAP